MILRKNILSPLAGVRATLRGSVSLSHPHLCPLPSRERKSLTSPRVKTPLCLRVTQDSICSLVPLLGSKEYRIGVKPKA